MNISERIYIDEKVCNGKPVIKGTRITVQSILDFLSNGESPQAILKQFPALEILDIQAALKFAAIQMGKNYSLI
jgi:uncharacterized protein (DUF433 family)